MAGRVPARATGPCHRSEGRGPYPLHLAPDAVHTIVLWSKDFSNLLGNAHGLKDLLAAYDQLYMHFTVTGLGTLVEPGVPDYRAALAQLPALVALAGDPLRVSVRFDPILFWKEGCRIRSNVDLFSEVAEASAAAGVRDIRVSFAQWYGRAARRAAARDIAFYLPPEEEQRSHMLVLRPLRPPAASFSTPAASRFSPGSRASGRRPASTGRSSNRFTRGLSPFRCERTRASASPASARSRRISAATPRGVRTPASTVMLTLRSPHPSQFPGEGAGLRAHCFANLKN